MDKFKETTWTYTDPATAKKFDFTLVNLELTWKEATDVCIARGEQLVQPDNPGKNQFLVEKLRTIADFTSNGAWFGASRNPQDINQWLYTDGSAVVFTSWGPGRGNLKVQLYVIFFLYLIIPTLKNILKYENLFRRTGSRVGKVCRI